MMMHSTALQGGTVRWQQLHFGKACPSLPRRRSLPCVQAQAGGDFGENLRRVAKQVQASLPIVGLISRLTAPEGGVGSDMQAYPEFCRAVFEAAPEGFQIAVAELQNRYGQPCQRRYVLQVLWMARLGAGVLPGKSIVDSARRLRFSQDLEFEMERFEQNIKEVFQKYTYLERPTGTLQQQAEVAVDGLARLCLGLKDGEAPKPEDIPLLEKAAAGAFWDIPGGAEAVRQAVETREQRAEAYVV